MKHSVPARSLPLQQHPYFAAALAKNGVSVILGDPIVTQRRFGHLGTLRMVSRGPVWADDPDERLQCYAALRRAGVQIINAEHPDDRILRAAGYRQIVTPAHVAEVDLTRPDALAAMSGKWRNRLFRAKGHGLSVTHRPFDRLRDHWLLQADAAQQGVKGFRNYPARITRGYAAEGKGATSLFLVDGAHGPLAALLFLNHAPRATYHIGWSSDEGRALNLHNLLMAHAIAHYRTRHFERLDLGQIDTRTAPGLARFKLGCGAEPRKLGGTWLRLPVFTRRRLA